MRYFALVLGALSLPLMSAGCGGGSASAQTETIDSINLGPMQVRQVNPLNGQVALFLGAEPSGGHEPWVTDGTDEGTFSLDIRPGVAASIDDTLVDQPWFVIFQGLAYFLADDGTHGFELWRTDGTLQGTELVEDLIPGPDGFDIGTYFTALENRLIIHANPPFLSPGDTVMYTLEVGP